MKRKLALLLLILSVSPILAQDYEYEDDIYASKNYPIGIGAFMSYSGGVNAAQTPQGTKNRFLAANMIDFGAVVYYPLSREQQIGLITELGIFKHSYGYETDPGGAKSDVSYNYFMINPALWFKGFRVGVNLAFPTGGTYYPDADDRDNTLDIQTQQMSSPMIELALGAYFPIYENEMGRLNFSLSLSYAVTGQTNSDFLDKGTPNQNPAAARIGLSYIFNINKSDDY